MGAPSKLSQTEMYELKSDLWNGASHQEVMDKYDISYQTSVLAKSGKVYVNIPWPDGSTGRMPDARKNELADAKRYSTRSERAAHRATAAPTLDGQLTFAQRQSVDETARRLGFKNWIAYEEHLFREKIEAQRKKTMAEHEAKMRKFDERERRLEANPALAERYKAKRAAHSAYLIRKYRPEEANRVQLPMDQVDPDANEKLPWDDVVALSKAKVVAIAAAEEHEPSLRLAIQIVFRLLSPRQWEEDHTLRMIYAIKQKIENYWAANAEEIEVN